MANAIYSVVFKLKKGASTPDFLAAAKKLNDEYISKQKGYISWTQSFDTDKEIWSDFCTFETKEDVLLFLENSSEPNEHALAFYAFINLPSCRSNIFTVQAVHSKA